MLTFCNGFWVSSLSWFPKEVPEQFFFLTNEDLKNTSFGPVSCFRRGNWWLRSKRPQTPSRCLSMSVKAASEQSLWDIFPCCEMDNPVSNMLPAAHSAWLFSSAIVYHELCDTFLEHSLEQVFIFFKLKKLPPWTIFSQTFLSTHFVCLLGN